MSGRRKVAIGLVGFGSLIVAAMATGVRAVKPGERVVVRRFGRVVRPGWGPGIHVGLPLGLDRFESVRTDEVRRVSVGTGPSASVAVPDPAAGEFLTGDLNLAHAQAVVQYRVARPEEWLARAQDPERLLRSRAESALARALARRGIDPILRDDRPAISREVAGALGRAAIEVGVEVLGVSLTEARPPAEVAEDFLAADSAQSRRDGRVTEATTLAGTTATRARAEADAVVERARSSAERRQVAARAEAGRFLAMLEAARLDRPLTIRRLYLDAMAEFLPRAGRKVIVPADGSVDLGILGDTAGASVPR
ncbi:Modulator of FtsH protease HflK [Aquisphaera giovannonii]|uniref:Modulator of FtsH protease HflK n=1 Tax=Aquisphaera giovannonii TaxID=406548 RepID=A0A5B9WBN8_9BACT|nr:SPFH domain-containing protein [Aquisphaera giovannonii]QEH37431.1 Modulator of FtsH protease HflK [Aquisphaera giovannonii]